MLVVSVGAGNHKSPACNLNLLECGIIDDYASIHLRYLHTCNISLRMFLPAVSPVQNFRPSTRQCTWWPMESNPTSKKKDFWWLPFPWSHKYLFSGVPMKVATMLTTAFFAVSRAAAFTPSKHSVAFGVSSRAYSRSSVSMMAGNPKGEHIWRQWRNPLGRHRSPFPSIPD